MRIKGLDTARALAILGMMLVNYKIVFSADIVKHLWLSRSIELLEGRAAGVFLVLAGIGLSLMTKNKDEKAVKVIVLKRAVFLFIIGTILYWLNWTADILHYYGVYMILILPLLFSKIRSIIISIITVLFVTLILQVSLDYLKGWDQAMVYLDFYTIEGYLRHTFFNGYHPIFPWLAFIMFGLIIGRQTLEKASTLKTMFFSSLSIAIVTELLSWWMTSLDSGDWLIYLFDTKPMNPSVFYVIAGSAWALAFISLIIYLVDYKGIEIKALQYTGQMALTHYIIHSILVLGVFEALGLISYQSELFVLILSLIVFAVMILYSTIRGKQSKRGHFELLMRKL